MSKKCYSLKKGSSLKSHKVFRGLRCYVSSFIFSKHTTKPSLGIEARVGNILSNLSPFGKSACIFSFHKSMHSSILLVNSTNLFTYASAYGSEVVFCEFFSKQDIIKVIRDEMELWGDELNENNLVYISGLDRLKMMGKLRNLSETFEYRLMSNNCSRFVADVLISGCTRGAKFKHDRPWQMPANTLELAKEIDRFHLGL
ncbi:hypothetical protein V5K00_RS22325 [Enterobacter asburiae]